MASKYFSGTAPTSYLPPGFMESATAPGRYYAEAMGSAGKAIGAGLAKRNERKKDKAYFDFVERMGETKSFRTETIPGVEAVRRGRPTTDEASGDYFNDQMQYRESHLGHLGRLEDMEKSHNSMDRIEAYAKADLPDDHPLHQLIKDRDAMITQESDVSSKQMSSNFNNMLLQSIDSNQGFDVYGIDAASLKRINNESLKWLKDRQTGTKEIIKEHEDNLDDFMKGVDLKTGEPLMEMRATTKDIKVPLSLRERREIVTSDLAGMARSMGRERYKDAFSEVDKLFPRTPELDVIEKSGALIITQDGAYKAAMAKPKLQGNSLFDKLSEASQKLVPGLQDDVRKDPTISKYIESYSALNIMKSAAGLKSGAGDLALITKFMKALDPESVVRESEMAAAQRTTSAFGVIEAIMGQLTTGAKLTDQQRIDIVGAAEKLVATSGEMATFKVDDYKEKGSFMGIPNELFVPKLPGQTAKAEVPSGPVWDPVNEEWVQNN